MADDKQINTVRRSIKRKLEDSFTVIDSSDEDSSLSQQQQQDDDDLSIDIREFIEVLENNSSDRALIKSCIQIFSELAKIEDNVNLLVGSGVVPALVKHLQEPQWPNEAVPSFDEFVTRSRPLQHEVEKGSAFTLGLLAIKPEHQQLIVDAGALPHLVALLKRHRDNLDNGVIREVAGAITNLACKNGSIKTRVKVEGGIPPLVALLESNDAEVQRVVARALCTLAFKNDENKTQIVDHNALPTLVLMLQSEDTGIHYEAVSLIRNLVNSSPKIKMDVLHAGALQPLIKLLSSTCLESQRKAASILRQFAAAPEHQQLIVDAGALPQLVAVLKRHRDSQNSKVVNRVIRKAVDVINNLDRIIGSIMTRVGVEGGIIPPLVALLESNDAEVQMVGARALLILASKNDEYKTQIVDHNALPTLVLMLQSEDTDIHYEAVSVIGNLVYSSPKIKTDVLNAGALQPIIKLLSSTCLDTQRKAALILRQFAAAPEHQKLIVDAGALPHLVAVLKRNRDNQNSKVVNRVIRKAVNVITNLARENGSIMTRVRVEGGIPPLVELLKSTDAKVQRAAVGALHVLASKNDENKTQIVDHNALPTLVLMLQSEDNGIHYQAVSVIGYLVNSSPKIKMDVLHAGALQPLIKLLSSTSTCLESQRTAALLLVQFAPEHQQLIVDAGALPHLVALLKRNNQKSQAVNGVIWEVVDAITNLSLDNDRSKTRVRVEGGIPPLVELLKSNDAKVQRAAARALCLLASTNDENKTQIVDHNALPALALMLESEDTSIHYQAVSVIGNLANSSPKIKMNVLHGALQPLVKLLSSTCLESQREAALLLEQFAVDTHMKDNVADLISVGGVQKLMDGEFIVQPTRDCAAKILRTMEDKIHGKVLSHLLYKMHNAEKIVQRRIILALAHLCSPEDQEAVFVDNNGLYLLLELLQSAHSKHQGDACVALCRLAEKATSVSPVADAGPSSPISKVYLGEEYVNNPMVSDVTFIVEGKRFHAHRIVLLASSDAFRAMFDGGYKERDAKDVQIPNITWETFELMMRFIYTGSVEVNMGIPKDLLKAADQYLLDGLKRLCEYTMAKDIKTDNLALMYNLSETSNAVSLRNSCILFFLEQFDELHSKPWYASFVLQILPEIRNYFMTTLTKPIEANLQEY